MVGCAGYLKPPAPERKVDTYTSDQHQQLENGMQVIVLPDKLSRTVHVELRYLVGSAHDPVGKEGLAHLVEHLMFAARSGGGGGPTFADQLAELTHSWNAGTTHERTQYHVRVAPPKLGAVVQIMLRHADLLVGWIGEAPAMRAW